MSTYLADGVHFQPANPVAGSSVSAWCKRQLAARREKRIAALHIRHLRTLDRHALEDIGVDIARLYDVRPSIVDVNPVSVLLSPFLR